jgi:OOP family OmpA-OmpF porin
MNRKTQARIRAAALAAGLAFSAPLMAQQAEAPTGFYAGGSVGMNDDNESTWRLLGWYQLHRNFALELGYHDLGDMTVGGQPTTATAWELVGLGILPLNDRLSFYGKAGAYRAELKGSGLNDKHSDLTFGLGGQYDLGGNLGVRVEWQRYTDVGAGSVGQPNDADIISVGAIYRFR